jgi:hypothetical protein
MNGWDFLTHGLSPFSSSPHQRGGLEKYPKGSSNIIHNNPCKISTSFFIQGHLLGLGLQTILM